MFGLLGWQLKLAEIVVCVALCFGAYNYVGHRAVEAYKTEQSVTQAKADREATDKYNKLSQELEDLKKKRQQNAITIQKETERIIERPVYLNTCIDNDGLYVANAAIQGRDISKPKTEVQTDRKP